MRVIATIHNESGVCTGIVDGADADNQEIVVNGRVWRFDYDERWGPLWLKKDGSPRKCQVPTNHAVWAAWDEWRKKWEARKKNQPTPTT